MSKEMKLLGTAELIDAAIKSMHTRGQRLQSDTHLIACSVLSHVMQHKDVRIVAKFLNACSESTRVNALRSWFEHFGPVTFDGNVPCYVRGGNSALGAAMKMPFWQFKPEAVYVPLDVQAAIASLLKKVVKDEAKTGIDHSAVKTALEQMQPQAPAVQ